jgi:hypothetical protein
MATKRIVVNVPVFFGNLVFAALVSKADYRSAALIHCDCECRFCNIGTHPNPIDCGFGRLGVAQSQDLYFRHQHAFRPEWPEWLEFSFAALRCE